MDDRPGRLVVIGISAIALTVSALAQGDPGRKAFESRCARCHGADGKGGEMGPAIIERLVGRDDDQLADLIRQGFPDRGMPPAVVPDAEMAELVKFLRTIQRHPEAVPRPRRTVQTTDGRTLSGEVLAEGLTDLQLLTDDKRVRLLRHAGERFREVTSQRDWPTYNGDPGGNRYTALPHIDKSNVARLAPKWVFPLPGTSSAQVTPVVVSGIMYVAEVNACVALDAGTGRQLWRYQRPRSRAATGHTNRGVGVAGERVFMVTDNAHIIALDRHTGELLWDTTLDDWRKNYSATSAPLPAGDLVITGVTGGEHGANGFVAAYDQATGREIWRFRTVPKPGEPGSETWKGKDIEHGGAPTWFTGTYDPELDLVYWPTGNPAKEYNGDDRQGDNLYSDSILALDRKTGRLRWFYQFTPHDLWDWDATETPVLVDADWQGQPRKLMLHANRNGFFYVFDRRDGKLLLARQFIKLLTWARGIGPDGRPVKVPGQEPSAAGTKVCPSQDGATNWYSPSFNPATGLYYVQTNEKCSIYTKRDAGDWESGKTYLGGSQRTAPDPKPERILRAIDIRTGDVRWELLQPGTANSWGGTLATASGLVIFGEDSGAFMAVDASSGAPLWTFQTNHNWKASPMTYVFDNIQHVAVAAGPHIIAFTVPK
jgi:alcohol dehydrogenase (cytochrome c)